MPNYPRKIDLVALVEPTLPIITCASPEPP